MAQDTDKSLRQQVIYQIFTRNYRSGKLKDVERDLDRIRDLGVDIIYLLQWDRRTPSRTIARLTRRSERCRILRS